MWQLHRWATTLLFVGITSLIVLVVGGVLNIWLESPLLTRFLHYAGIILNFGMAWCSWKLYVQDYKAYYKKFSDSHKERIKRYKFMLTIREDLMREYPNSEPLPFIDRPVNWARSYRKVRWLYWFGILLNLLLGFYHLLR